MTFWDIDTGEQWFPGAPNLDTRTYRTAGIYELAYSPDGRRLLTRSGAVRIWDAATGAEISTLVGQGAVGAVAWSPDGRRIAVGSGDASIKVFDAGKGEELFALRGHTNFVQGVAFSPDGSRLAIAVSPEPFEVALWDTATGQEVFAFRIGSRFRDSRVQALAWSADGSTLTVGDHVGDIRFWSAAPRKQGVQIGGRGGG